MDRDVDPAYEAYMDPSSLLYDRREALTAVKAKDAQGDITDPIITSMDTIPGTVNQAFEYDITIDENSFAVTSTGVGMPLSI